MRTSRVYNVLQSPGTGVTATGTDFQLYCRAAAKNAKDKYAKRLIDNAASDYWGFYTPVWSPYRWRNVFDPLIAPMLRDAILITAQFLVAWMQVAKKAATPPGNVGNVAPRKAMNGYYTCVSAALARYRLGRRCPAAADSARQCLLVERPQLDSGGVLLERGKQQLPHEYLGRQCIQRLGRR